MTDINNIFKKKIQTEVILLQILFLFNSSTRTKGPQILCQHREHHETGMVFYNSTWINELGRVTNCNIG